MKICWDNIENIRLTENGNFRDTVKKQTYHYNESCKTCKEPFLGKRNAEYCDKSCKKHSKETKENFSNIRRNIWNERDSVYTTEKYKEKQSTTHKKIRKDVNSIFNSKEYRKKLSVSSSNENNPNWKGGYSKKNIPIYDTYAHQIEWCEEVRRNKEDPNVLEVKCFKCSEWHVPTLNNVSSRIQHLKGNPNSNSENLFYCSTKCKNSCSIFGKTPEALMKEDAIRAGRLPWLVLTREIQPELRQMVLERDEHKCVKCNSEKDLQCHHILPVNIEPLLSTDIDNCITLCSKCHKKVHQEIDGCGYGQLRNIGIC